jgi:hypothetical protein
LGRDAVAEGADGELGVAEEGGVIGSDKGAGDVQDVVVAGLGDGLGQLLRFGFLSGGEGLCHGRFSDGRSGFFSKTHLPRLVYKDPTNFRDAHTPGSFRAKFACQAA